MIRAVIFDMYETLITHYHTEGKLYFSGEMAADAGVPMERFRTIWRGEEAARTVGALSLEDTLTRILKENHCYSEEKVALLAKKRSDTAKECYHHLHPEILPMLTSLKERGILTGLISNCFSEEALVIRECPLAPYFDAITLSYEEKVKKPDPAIYYRCLDALQVKPEECLYVGDGGSHELEAARDLGMTALQAVWYLKEGTLQASEPRKDFPNLESPLTLFTFL